MLFFPQSSIYLSKLPLLGSAPSDEGGSPHLPAAAGGHRVDLLADMQLNPDYCAVRYEGKIQLHVLEGEGVVTEDRERERERERLV